MSGDSGASSEGREGAGVGRGLPRVLAVAAVLLFAGGLAIGLTPVDDDITYVQPGIETYVRTFHCGVPLRAGGHEDVFFLVSAGSGQPAEFDTLCDGFRSRRSLAGGLLVGGALIGAVGMAAAVRRHRAHAYGPVLRLSLAAMGVGVISGVLAAPRPRTAWWCETHVATQNPAGVQCEPAAAAFRQASVLGVLLALLLALAAFGLWRLRPILIVAVVASAAAIAVAAETLTSDDLPTRWPAWSPALVAVIGLAGVAALVRWVEKGASRPRSSGARRRLSLSAGLGVALLAAGLGFGFAEYTDDVRMEVARLDGIEGPPTEIRTFDCGQPFGSKRAIFIPVAAVSGQPSGSTRRSVMGSRAAVSRPRCWW